MKTPTPRSTHRTFLLAELVSMIVVRSEPRRGWTHFVDAARVLPGLALGVPSGEPGPPWCEPPPAARVWIPQPAASARSTKPVANFTIAVRRIACTLRLDQLNLGRPSRHPRFPRGRLRTHFYYFFTY